MSTLVIRKITLIVLFLIFLGQGAFALEANSGVYQEDTSKYRSLEPILQKENKFDLDDYNTYTVEKAVVFVKKGVLTDTEIVTLARRIAEGVTDVEKYLKIPLESIYGNDARIYYIIGDFDISQTYGGYRQNQIRQPIVFLTRVGDVAGSFYLHETVHIFTPNYSSLWLREGVADLLNDRLGGYQSFRYKARGIDVVAKQKLDSPAMVYVGQNGIPNINRKDPEAVRLRNEHYVLAYSFVKYLEEHIGIDKIMEIYNDKDTLQAISNSTGKTVDQWKTEWIFYLKNK